MAKNAISDDDSVISLWKEREAPNLPKQGPYADLRSQLVKTFATAKRMRLLKKVSSHTYAFSKYGGTYSSYSQIQTTIDFKNNEVKVAVKASHNYNGDTRFFNITDTGHPVDIDEFGLNDEWMPLKEGLSGTLSDLHGEIASQRREWKDRISGILRILVIVGAVLLVGLLVFFCLRWWIFEPQEAANRARVAYDAGNHQIAGEGHQVAAHPLATIPSGTLQSMPSYGGDDKTLTHPRTISVSSSTSAEWCNSIKVDIPLDSTLVVAVGDDSLFVRDLYATTYADEMLTVCLVDGFVNNEASERVTAKLALQVKPQGKAD